MGRPKGSKNKAKVEEVSVAPPKVRKAQRVIKAPAKIVATEEAFEDEDEGEEPEDDGLSTSKPAYVPDLRPAAPQAVSAGTADLLAQATIQLGQAIQAMNDSGPIKKVPFSKFKTKSPFNPTGNKKRKLTRRVYQNHYRVDVKKLHDEEIALLNILKPGRYLNGVLTVREIQNGQETDLHLLYDNKSTDQKFTVMREFRGHFTEMLKRCVNEGPKPIEARD